MTLITKKWERPIVPQGYLAGVSTRDVMLQAMTPSATEISGARSIRVFVNGIETTGQISTGMLKQPAIVSTGKLLQAYSSRQTRHQHKVSGHRLTRSATPFVVKCVNDDEATERPQDDFHDLVGMFWRRKPAITESLSELVGEMVVRVISRKPRSTRFVWPKNEVQAIEYLEDETLPLIHWEDAILSITDFEIEERNRLRVLSGLARYIDKYRLTRDEDRITVVGSAVRNYAMLMDESHFEEYGRWLYPARKQTVSSAVQGELLKGICWRIQFHSRPPRGKFPTLQTMAELAARTFVNKETLKAGPIGAVALNAIVASFLLNTVADEDRWPMLWQLVCDSERKWFKDMVLHRLQEAVDYIGEHNGELSEGLKKRLSDLEQESTCQHGR